MKENAKREAQLLVREAQLNSEKLMEEGRAEEAKIRADIQGLRRMRRQIVEDLRATIDRYHRLLMTETVAGDGDAKEAKDVKK